MEPPKKNQLESLLEPLDGARSPCRTDLPEGETQAGHEEITMVATTQPLHCTGALRQRGFAF